MDSATLKFALAAALAFALLYNLGKKPERFQAYESDSDAAEITPEEAPKVAKSKSKRGGNLLKASKGADPRMVPSVDPDALPKPPVDDGFAAFAPGDLTSQNFVDASRWVSLGAMTTKRNLNRDLRAEIPIPKNSGISPWLNSTIDQQPVRKALE